MVLLGSSLLHVRPSSPAKPRICVLRVFGKILLGRLGTGLAFPLKACQARLTMALPRHTEQVPSRAWSSFFFCSRLFCFIQTKP